MAETRPLVTVYGADGAATGASVPLPGVFAAPIRPDVVRSVHTNIAKGAGFRSTFPFVYKGTTYEQCTEMDDAGKPWCHTEPAGWGYCGPACQGSSTGTTGGTAGDEPAGTAGDEPIGTDGDESTGTDGGELTGTDGDEGVTPVAYKFLKFDPVALRGASIVQIAEIAFKSGSEIVDMSGAVATNPGGNNPGREKPEKGIDGDIHSKWLDKNKKALIIEFPSPVSPTSYRFTTANDVDGRDPVSWKLEGSQDGSTWTILDEVFDYATTNSRKTATPWFDILG